MSRLETPLLRMLSATNRRLRERVKELKRDNAMLAYEIAKRDIFVSEFKRNWSKDRVYLGNNVVSGD